MKLWKYAVRWYLGGMGYTALELLWRGWSHGSMFVVGGLCFLMLGTVGRVRIPLAARMVLGACLVTAAELLAGLLLNLGLGMRIWDYSGMPCNLLGQICLPYFLLWHPVSLGAILLDAWLRAVLPGTEKRPREIPGGAVVTVRFQPEGL